MIYFAQSPQGDPIKIGVSIDPEWRIEKLRRQFRQELVIVGTMLGGRGTEFGLHERFADVRCRGCCEGVHGVEWFHPTESLAGVITLGGGRVIGPTVPDPMPGTPMGNARDGADLLRRHLRSHDLSNLRASRTIGCSAITLGHWIQGKVTPSDVAADILEIWSNGEVPKRSWMTIDGRQVVSKLSHGRTNKSVHAAQVKRLDEMRLKYYGGEG